MAKSKIEANVFIPMPVCIVGTADDEKENYMAAGWITRVESNPPLLAVGIGKGKLSWRNISRNGEFSVNFPSSKDVEKTDYVGIVSGDKADKASLFTARYGALAKAPMIEECPLSLGCRVSQAVDLPTHTLFIGEIIEAFAENEYLEKDGFSFSRAGTFLLTMRDNTYWSFGRKVGSAWKDGKALKK